jgi:hypothetical protein
MINVHPKYEGTPCGDLTETAACNMQACDKDCELGEWSEWDKCSKACNRGSQKRRKGVIEAAIGRGECPSSRSRKRLNYRSCNRQKCIESFSKPLTCKSKVDVVLVLDSSGSTGSKGFEQTKSFAKTFTTALEGQGTDAMLSVISFSGPGRWSLIRKCTGADTSGLDMEKDCKIKLAEHYTSDMAAARSKIDGLEWMAGLTLTSTALEMAASEISLGRRGVNKIVLMVTDGRPTKKKPTDSAARKIRSMAKLIIGAVGLGGSNLQDMMKWASSPAKENVFNVRNYQTLDSVKMVDDFIADVCEEVDK